MMGVLVLPDRMPLPWHLPAMHLATFVKSIQKADLELLYQRLVTPNAPSVPFVLLNSPTSRAIYIAPPVMLERKDVLIWRVKAEDWYTEPHAHYFKRIVHAEPLR